MEIENLETDDFISKSQKKRDAKAIQALAKKLIALPQKQLTALELDDNTTEAIHTASTMPAKAALKRQIQYIAKCLNQQDPEAIMDKLEKLQNRQSLQSHQIKKLEQWRDRLLQNSQDLAIFIEQYPSVDRQQLRQCIRNANKEYQQEKPGKAYKQLYQIIKQQVFCQ